jgi:hypothetical protein
MGPSFMVGFHGLPPAAIAFLDRLVDLLLAVCRQGRDLLGR